MKFTLTFKHPDVLDQIDEQTNGDEVEIARARKLARTFVEYDEYVYIDVDTNKGTATVRRV